MISIALLLPWLLMAVAGAVLFSEDVQAPTVPIAVTTTSETLVATGNNLTVTSPNCKAVIRAWLELTVGTAATAITITIYRGNAIGGTVVGQQNHESGDFTAGDTSHFEVEFIDLLSNVVSAQYCMSVTQTGATGNGSVTSALIDTKLLSG